MVGLPVVCTSFDSAKEIIDSPDVGILVAVDDEKAMAAEVNELLDDPDSRLRLGTQSRLRAKQRFGWDTLVREMELLYTELAKGCDG